jgi:hypothetical protein
MSQRLYSEDFYLWTQAQATAIEAEGMRSRSNAVDWELVAEEIRDLGASQLRQCVSRATTILEHLYKLAWTRRTDPRAGWRETIRTQRRELVNALTPSIEKMVRARLEDLHDQAGADAGASFADHEPETPIDATLRWTWDAVLGHADDPLKDPA